MKRIIIPLLCLCVGVVGTIVYFKSTFAADCRPNTNCTRDSRANPAVAHCRPARSSSSQRARVTTTGCKCGSE